MLKKMLIVSAVSAAALGAQAETVKIALAGPTTGPVAQYGDMAIIGAQMAIEQINKAGGFDGHMLEGVIYDDACEPKQATAVANKIVNDGIRFVVGHLCTGSSMPASDIYEDEGIIMITAASTGPDLTERGYEFIFRTIGRDDQQGPVAAQYIIDNIKPKRVAVVHDKQAYGEGVATQVKQTLESAKVNVVLFEAITANEQDYSALVSKLKAEKIDFVYYGGYDPELGLILRQSRDAGFDAQFMGPDGISNKNLIAKAGDAAEGILATQPKAFEEDPKNADLVKAFEAKKQDPSGAFVFPAYSAVLAMAQAMDATDTIEDTEAVVEYLKNNSFDTPTGTISWDAKGDLKAGGFYVYQWSAKGTKVEK